MKNRTVFCSFGEVSKRKYQVAADIPNRDGAKSNPDLNNCFRSYGPSRSKRLFIAAAVLLLCSLWVGWVNWNHFVRLQAEMKVVLEHSYHQLNGTEGKEEGSDVFAGNKKLARKTPLTSFRFSPWEVRFPSKYEKIPKNLINAIIATEDQKYFHHLGIDILGIGRAAIVNFLAGHVVQGGSTITQQLVKSLIGRTDRTFSAKFEEVLLALLVERFYSKKDILEAYCNTIYLGQIGPYELHGINAAAKHLLGKQLSELTTADCAMLAGIIRGPNALSPLKHFAEAQERAQTVLSRMQALNMLTEGTKGSFTKASQKAEVFNDTLYGRIWFYRLVENEIAQLLSHAKADDTFTINLTLDPRMQQAAIKNLASQLSRLNGKEISGGRNLQGAVVALDVQTGGVRALVGGSDWRNGQFNRAVDSRRQIGSLVKPFVYLAAMQNLDTVQPVQLQLVEDRPLEKEIDGRVWHPVNFDHRYRGTMTWEQALVASRNIPAVRVGDLAGVDAVANVLDHFQLGNAARKGPAIFLGAVESSPLQVAAAYRTIAAGGTYRKPIFIEGIYKNGVRLPLKNDVQQILDPGEAYVMTDMLCKVLTSGTGKSSSRYGIVVPVAGKTGTSSNLRDGWFAGYSPKLALSVWIGRDDNRPTGYTGAVGALPVWAELMRDFGGDRWSAFPVPKDIRFVSAGGIAYPVISNNRSVIASLVECDTYHDDEPSVGGNYLPERQHRPLEEVGVIGHKKVTERNVSRKVARAKHVTVPSQVVMQPSTGLSRNTEFLKATTLKAIGKKKPERAVVYDMPQHFGIQKAAKKGLAVVKDAVQQRINEGVASNDGEITVQGVRAKLVTGRRGTPLQFQKYRYFE